MTDMPDTPKDEHAANEERITHFFVHAALFLTAESVFFLYAVIFNIWPPFIAVLLGWGSALLIHGFSLFIGHRMREVQGEVRPEAGIF